MRLSLQGANPHQTLVSNQDLGLTSTRDRHQGRAGPSIGDTTTAQVRDWSDFALLLIDVQNGCWDIATQQQFPDFPRRITQLLTFCRAEGIMVIHLHVGFQPDKSDWMPFEKLGRPVTCITGTPEVESPGFASPTPDEVVLQKHTVDGFLQPQLLPLLTHHQKRFLLMAGLNTSVCVLFTTVSAVQHGFLTAVVEDCCADWSPQAHNFILRHFDRSFFHRTTVGQITDAHAEWVGLIRQLAHGEG
jgi:nicotinamidase-related amidase